MRINFSGKQLVVELSEVLFIQTIPTCMCLRIEFDQSIVLLKLSEHFSRLQLFR